MPFREVLKGKKRKVVVEIRGPRDKKQQARLKKALGKVLKQHNAAVKAPKKRK